MFKHFEPNRIRSLVGWDVLEDQGGPMVPTLRFIRAHQLLPESYVYGFEHTYRFSRYRKAFPERGVPELWLGPGSSRTRRR